MAQDLGFKFEVERPSDVSKRLWMLKWLGGGTINACHIMSGRYKERSVLMFDVWGNYYSGNQPVNFCMSAALAASTRLFPRLEIMPEKLIDKATDTLEDIDFESHEFNREFLIKSPDRKFAYAVISPRMMGFLLANRIYRFELIGPNVLIFTGGLWNAEEFRQALGVLSGFLELMPDHVLRDLPATADPSQAGLPTSSD